MPKMKTHRGAAARFRATRNGKLLRRQAKLNHILSKKSPATKRRLRATTSVAKGDRAAVKRMLGL